MSRPELAQSLLSLLAVQGIDAGSDARATAGLETRSAGVDGEPLVTLILEGVAARRAGGQTVSLGLAAAGDLINFDAVMGEATVETGLWVTPGRYVEVPVTRLLSAVDRPTLMDAALQDLRRRNSVMQTELGRHARGLVSQRLAALLLDVHSLGGGDSVALRQSDIAALLAVRRAGVSAAGGELRARGAVRIRRGAVELTDIDALRSGAG